jgi:Fe-S-cluster containining protein
MCDATLISAVHAAARRAEVCAAVQAVYTDLQQQIDLRHPLCQLSGRCCHFEEWGHRLYVTTMELASFVAGLERATEPTRMEVLADISDGRGCPFQAGKLCGVHAIRPFGCRIYFCDATAQEWQQEQYAHFHARLRRLHDELAVPYFYLEWRQALAGLFGVGK